MKVLILCFLFAPIVCYSASPKQTKAKGVCANGIVISDVKPGSVFAQVGIQSRDRLLSFNNRPIKTTDDLQALVNRLAGEPGLVNLKIIRKGREETLRYELKH